MYLIQKLKKIVFTFDLFCSSELLRYNQDTQYKTFTGGVLSLGIIVIIVIGFFSMISDTLNKTSITSSTTYLKQSNPPLFNLIANQQNNFMFGIGITSMNSTLRLNMSAPSSRYFDIYMITGNFLNGRIVSTSMVPLQQCTKQHWKMVPQFYEKFDLIGGSRWLCLPIDYTLPLQGSYSSSIYKVSQISVYACRNRTVNGTCAPQADIDNLFNTYGSFLLSYKYVNTAINPNLPSYISYYLQQNDFSLFSKNIGTQSWIEFTDFTINTDSSLLPFTDLTSEIGSIIQTRSFSNPCTPSDSLLATVILTKSSNSIVYNRQVQKISAVFSYIGGLVGAVTAFLFMVKSYTDSSLEITIGLNVFQDANKEHESFNLLGFIRLAAYRILRLFKWKGEWKIAQKYQDYQKEAVKQLDICLLLKRLIMLQTCINKLLPLQEINKINQNQQELVNLKSARKMRTLLLKKQNGKEIIPVQFLNDFDKEKQRSQSLSPNLSESSWFDTLGRSRRQENKNMIKGNGAGSIEEPETEISKKLNGLYIINNKEKDLSKEFKEKRGSKLKNKVTQNLFTTVQK